MNKKTILIALSFCCLAIGAWLFKPFQSDATYSPRQTFSESIDGYSDYINMMRANQHTGVVTNEDVAAARAAIRNNSGAKHKTDWPLNWEFRGPDNVGGRTRCLVIDKDNSNVMYTGGVSGSVFKTTNKGGSWFPLTSGEDNFGVVSMAQTSDGHIYYGTGEGGLGVSARGTEGSGFNGMGMFKSTDGQTFTPVANSENFNNIFVLTPHPTENVIFCGSSNGLRMSSDAGATWELIRQGSCRDIKINKNGVALALIGNNIWRATNPKDASSYERVSGFSISSRSAIAWSASDPDYSYVVSVGNSSFDGISYVGALVGLYKSTDGGASFEKVVGQISQFFAPFTILGLQAQGNYDMAIGVHPRDKDRVFIGGIRFAEWSEKDGPRIVGNTFNSPFNKSGIHSDKHFITFDDSGDDPVMFICTDGGISRTTNAELDEYKDINTGLSTTQFFGIAADINGRIIGGTQDNGTMLLSGESFPRDIAQDLLGGDGFQCAISEFNPQYMFGESQQGNLRRSITGGGSMESIWDNRVESVFASANNPTNYFDNPLCLWENPEIVAKVKQSGPQSGLDSLLDARLYFAMDDGVWMCKNALSKPHDPDNPKDVGAIRWFKINNITNVHYLQTSADGKHLFITTTNGRIYRTDSLLVAKFDTTSLPGYADIATKLINSTINISGNISVNGRVVTSIATDLSNPNRLIATVGNYLNTNYVFRTEDALSSSPQWTSIQGNLGKFPVYHAVVSVDNPDVIVVGTEFGVWATDNGTSATPTWAEANNGIASDGPMPKVPVFDLVQVENKEWTGPRIYAGTHGMGIWETRSLLTSVPKDITKTQTIRVNAYPNPANHVLNLETKMKGNYTLSVYNIQGKIVAEKTGSNASNIVLNTAEMVNGNYFIEILGENQKAVSKIIVQH